MLLLLVLLVAKLLSAAILSAGATAADVLFAFTSASASAAGGSLDVVDAPC